MGRRFVTSEDVSRAGGGEIVVDADTVVTPQALDAARAAGVVVRRADGEAYAEPPPDRGPDAEDDAVHPSVIPEPAGEPGGAVGVVVSVMGRNRPGILAEVTGALGELGADVRDISQKTIDEYFHMVLLAVVESPEVFPDLKERLQCMGGEDDYVVRVMHERVFRFMHRV